MTGLEKMIGRIEEESDTAAAKTIERAQAQADKILEEARRQAQLESDRIDRECASKVEDSKSRSRSAADLLKRRQILAEKQRLIGEVIEKAKQSLDTMSDGEYFGLIIKMAEKFALPQEGTVLFSKKDLARIPQGFEVVLSDTVGKIGGSLTVSRETRNINGGFVLVYGGVEENCSFTALFDSAHELLQDKVQELLFS